MVVRRGADAAEAEHHVLRVEAAAQSGSEPLRIVAEVLGPGEAESPLRQGADEERKVLVFALSDEDLVPDDESAEQLCGLFSPALQILETADVLAVDEDLRHG